MKKILIIFFIIGLMYAKDIDKYLNYVNELINYHFELKNFNKIKSPFEVKIVNGKTINVLELKKSIKINLISIFNKSAYVMIRIYAGKKLVHVEKKWIKIGDKIGNCIVKNILYNKLILKCKNKQIIKTLYKKILNLKDTK